MNKVVRVREKGDIIIPKELRRKWGIEPGDILGIEETDRGLLITRREVIAREAMDEIGEILRANGLTLEDMMERGREIRGQLTEEKYGLKDKA